MKQRVVVGMSGGVDSSVAALLLKEQGYEVIGLFMHNWNEPDNENCSSEDDFNDVRRVCSTLDIPYYSVDFSKEYYKNVFETFLHEYELGRTPNPDVLCNKEIKFGVFKDMAKKIGGDLVATGHYADITKIDGRTYLSRSLDENKDQTYFLNQVTEDQIRDVIFPLAKFSDKKLVREIAEKNNLFNAKKKDSTGICFIGERNFRKFLSTYLPMKEGKILTLDGKEVGTHKGVFYYTEGQHKGFGVGGIKGENNSSPWYIIKKDVKNNILYVNQGETDELYSNQLVTEPFNFITRPFNDGKYLCRIRHRQPLQEVYVEFDENKKAHVSFTNKQRAIVSGQYCVLYDDKICLGGGIIESH